MSTLTLFGAHLSPYVRKARLVLAFKGLEYKQVMVIPGSPDQPDEFKQNSPLRKIPMLKVGDNYISDSSVICAFLEREYPEKNLLPEDNLLAARAQWFEEYADSVMTSCIGGHLFAEKVLAKPLFKREPIQEDIDLAMEKELPAIFSYLDSQLNDDYLVGNQVSLADLAVCGLFVAMHHCEVKCDGEQWPKLAAYIDRVMEQDFFQKVVQEELMVMKMFLG